jgi:mannose-6-phosphate isomerase-like protein (cupin superfamily)
MKTKRLPIDHEMSGEWLQSRPAERFSIRVPASATNGYYSVTEILSSPGDSTPVHLHENEDEHILVVEGTAWVLHGEKTFDATAGTMVSLARGIPHAWFGNFLSLLQQIGGWAPPPSAEIARKTIMGITGREDDEELTK